MARRPYVDMDLPRGSHNNGTIRAIIKYTEDQNQKRAHVDHRIDDEHFVDF